MLLKHPAFFSPARTQNPLGLSVLYQDQYLIALNKPSGLLSVPGKGIEKRDSLSVRVQHEVPDAQIVHRIDCHTSGIMLMALGYEMQKELNRLFHDKKILKKYIAIVSGTVKAKYGIIDIPLRGDPNIRPMQIADYLMGKNSITQWKVLDYLNGTTRLELTPITGRTHQLRVHCKEIGYPIVGDRLYGYNDVQINNKYRMLLHAQDVSFVHPVTHQRINITADCEF